VEIKQPLAERPPVVDWGIFEGGVRAGEILPATATGGVRVYDVLFPAGARTVWHTHSVDQLLVVVDGEGIVATDDDERVVHVGDVIAFPAGERHWHGATADRAMRHLAIMNPGEDLL
jgi:quercetin dioxygenase-like cupin family protein